MNLDGTPVTADAIHCQSETAATALARGGDDPFALKGNRPALHADVTAFFADPPAGSLAWHETGDADHGRIEVRRHAMTRSVDWPFSDRRYAGEPAMPGLAGLAMVAGTVERDGPESLGQPSVEGVPARPGRAVPTPLRRHRPRQGRPGGGPP